MTAEARSTFVLIPGAGGSRSSPRSSWWRSRSAGSPVRTCAPGVPSEVMRQPEPRQGDRPFGQRLLIDDWPAVPTNVVVGVDDRFFPAEFQIRVSQDRLGITPDVIPGGHLVALSHPAELADRLLEY